MLKNYSVSFIAFMQQKMWIVTRYDSRKSLLIDYDGSTEESTYHETLSSFLVQYEVDNEIKATKWYQGDLGLFIDKLNTVFEEDGEDGVFDYIEEDLLVVGF